MFMNRTSKIVAVLIILVIVFLSTSFSTHAANIQTVKSSYNSIEFVRGVQPAIPPADRSYDGIELARNKQPTCGAASTCTADGCIFSLPDGKFLR